MGNDHSNQNKTSIKLSEDDIKKSVFLIPDNIAGQNLQEKDSFLVFLENKNITTNQFEEDVFPVIEKDERKIRKIALKKNCLDRIPKIPKKITFLDVRQNNLENYPEDYELSEIDISENKFKSYCAIPKSSAKNM